MTLPMIAAQYLEYSRDIAAIPSAQARARLRTALEHLPISCVILGWDLPEALCHACAQETSRAGARLFRWQPLLAGNSAFESRPEWQVIGLSGEPAPGRPGFTFLCPDCHRAASEQGLDLAAARRRIKALLAAPERLPPVLQLLLDPSAEASPDPDLALLRAFLDFRAHSITRFVQAASGLARREGLEVGLDCFSPCLAYMVGQNLTALSAHCTWIKIMTYGHTLAPAGLPYELLGPAQWLIGLGAAGEAKALDWQARVTCLPLSPNLSLLSSQGSPPEALAAEIRRARAAGVSTLLAGIELVDLEGVTRLDPARIAADLRAIRAEKPDGRVLSWDLWRIPLHRLETVRSIWLMP